VAAAAQAGEDGQLIVRRALFVMETIGTYYDSDYGGSYQGNISGRFLFIVVQEAREIARRIPCGKVAHFAYALTTYFRSTLEPYAAVGELSFAR